MKHLNPFKFSRFSNHPVCSNFAALYCSIPFDDPIWSCIPCLQIPLPGTDGVADGLTDRSSARAKKVLPAGAVLWGWDADPEYDEPAGEKWLFLLPKRWNKHVQYAWRYAPRELDPERNAPPLESAPRVELGASDDEYLTEDECMPDA